MQNRVSKSLSKCCGARNGMKHAARRLLTVSGLVLIGVLSAFASGFLYSYSVSGLPSEFFGFPLAWRYWVELCCIVQYRWLAFLVDVLFYIVVGFALLQVFRRVRLRALLKASYRRVSLTPLTGSLT